ncbi:AfsR/SARP family transcriptional regulator [Streptomyces sp. WM6372]|uniref:AfsR/SARP family transcriptional regulator n=1 Tax=Streptomyces sp. WM6372 TaxID=1415555 RepID=UPI0006B039FC|nr:AfsR/SARP family transcriptional regulator [Streptomyces sp. WM6372]
MEFTLLGPLTAVHEGTELGLGGNKQQMLLAYLLLHANRQVTVDEIVDVLWGDRPPASAVKNIHLYIGRLRRVFAAVEPGRRLQTVGRGYLLAAEPEELDLARTRSLARDGRIARRADDPERAARLFREALGLWRGRPLAALAGSDALAGEVRCLEELWLMLHEDYFQARLDTGRHREILPELHRLVAAHPRQERFRFQLMLAFSRSGDRAAALGVYRSGYRLLVDDLGIEPCRELRELHDRILADTVTAHPASAGPAGPLSRHTGHHRAVLSASR